MRGRIVCAMLALGLAAACGHKDDDAALAPVSPPSPAPTSAANPATPDPTDAVLAAIQQTEEHRQAALKAGNMAAGVAVYAPEAVFYEPGKPPVTGDQIRAAFDRMGKDQAYNLAIDDASRSHWVAKSGDLAVTSYTGSWTHTKAEDVATTEPLLNQTVWALQQDGTWKIVSDVNTVIEAPATE